MIIPKNFSVLVKKVLVHSASKWNHLRVKICAINRAGARSTDRTCLQVAPGGVLSLFFSVGVMLAICVPAFAEISYWSPKRQETPKPAKPTKPGLLGTGKPEKNKNDPDPAYSAFLHGEFLTALEEAEKAAKKGQPEAFTLIAYIFDKGLGVARNDETAYQWYVKGAAKGDVNAVFAKAVMQAKGRGTKKNMREAAVLFDKAARKGHAAAQYNLALIYINGLVVEENLSEAVSWLKKSAAQRNFQAQYDLGTLYALGQGVKKDKVKAEYWIGKAAKGGLINAELEYAVMLFNRFRTEKAHIRKTIGQIKSLSRLLRLKKMSEKQRWQAIKKIAGAKRLKAISKLPSEKRKVALKYLKDTPAAMLAAIPIATRKLTAKQRQKAVKRQLKILEKIRKKEDVTFLKAFEFLYSAAQKGNPIAQNRLARLYAYGHTPNQKKAVALNRFKGEIRQNFVIASKWHLLAKSRGISDAKLDLVFSGLSPKEQAKVYREVDDWENLTILN